MESARPFIDQKRHRLVCDIPDEEAWISGDLTRISERPHRQTSGIDALLLSVGSDLPYLIGYEAMPLERLTMLVLDQTSARLVVPRLEAPRVDAATRELVELVAGAAHGGRTATASRPTPATSPTTGSPASSAGATPNRPKAAAMVVGIIAAPRKPWMQRKKTSVSRFQARAHSALDATNPAAE